jgi:hypothetical protein
VYLVKFGVTLVEVVHPLDVPLKHAHVGFARFRDAIPMIEFRLKARRLFELLFGGEPLCEHGQETSTSFSLGQYNYALFIISAAGVEHVVEAVSDGGDDVACVSVRI